MYTDSDYARLADAASKRRDALDLTQMEVAQVGGLSLDRVSAIERGEARNLRPKTIRSLERGLRWQQGSVKAVLDGDADGRPAGHAPPRRRGRSIMDETEALMDENERLIADIQQLDDEARKLVTGLVYMLKRKSGEESRNDNPNR